MSDTIISGATDQQPDEPTEGRFSGLLASKRGRQIRESLLAYLFLLPAFIIIFTFGIFPLAFSAYESTLRGLNKVLGEYDGMGNYVKAVGDLAYVLGFWLAIVFIFLAVQQLRSVRQRAQKREDNPWLLAVPAVVMAVAISLFVRFFYLFLPELLGIADKMRDALRASEGEPGELFRRFLREAFLLPSVQRAFWLSIVIFIVGVVLTYLFFRSRPYNPRSGGYYAGFLQTTIYLVLAAGLGWFTWTQVQLAYTAALEEGIELSLWSQIVTISGGLVLLGLSWMVWRTANEQASNRAMVLRLGAGALLMIGAWVLIGELPAAAASGDEEWYYGLLHTIYYSAGSIPIQLVISLMLATFLFQNIKGKGLFRVIYFLPYITPTVGAAAAFRILFSGRVEAPVNQLVRALGFDALGWLNESTGVLQMLVGDNVILPDWAAGPSLTLVVIIIFGVWSYVGFNTVVYLAGLGSIPSALYEAAAIDGAGRWSQFRNITLPLLSPTIYFLTLYAVIGTFKAFNHIYVLRTAAALGTADTASIVIFDAMKRDTRYGYAAALAMLLLIIVAVLTVVNNRIASRRVFYG